MSLAIIGGTGFGELGCLTVTHSHAVDTPFGQCSAPVEEGELNGRLVFFLSRHGSLQTPIPPHLINYRANVWALRELGATRVLAVNAVGGIDPLARTGSLVVPHQLIDYSWGREHTFDDGSTGSLMHVDFTEPFEHSLRHAVLTAAQRSGHECIDGSVVGVTQGPRLETAAEIERLRRDGCQLVGMTSMPEAALAREAGIAYASICMVVNAAPGVDGSSVDHSDIRTVLNDATQRVASLLAFIE
ncbi:MAG: S-methyl-5'-thioinosine phosphorylase [Pseudomonadota bacterium]